MRLRRQASSAEGHRGGPKSRPPHPLGESSGAPGPAPAKGGGIVEGWDRGIEPTTLYRPSESVCVCHGTGSGVASPYLLGGWRNPWTRAPRELAVGADLDATVTRVMAY